MQIRFGTRQLREPLVKLIRDRERLMNSVLMLRRTSFASVSCWANDFNWQKCAIVGHSLTAELDVSLGHCSLTRKSFFGKTVSLSGAKKRFCAVMAITTIQREEKKLLIIRNFTSMKDKNKHSTSRSKSSVDSLDSPQRMKMTALK